MKIITTTVSLHGYHEVNHSRLNVLEQTLARAHHEQADLLCLPGGYFYYAPVKPITDPLASNEPELAHFIKAIIDLAKRYEIAIALGLDLALKDQTDVNEEDVRAGTLAWYALCWSPSDESVKCWNQRSVTSTDQFYCPEASCNERHTLQIQHDQVEILMCGEVFNSRIKEAITQRAKKPLALIDLAHTF